MVKYRVDRLTNDEVFVIGSSYARHKLKQRLIDDELIPHECGVCGLPPVWMDRPMVLLIDFLNGDASDRRLDKLRFVCSNCASQLPSYKGRQKRKFGKW